MEGPFYPGENSPHAALPDGNTLNTQTNDVSTEPHTMTDTEASAEAEAQETADAEATQFQSGMVEDADEAGNATSETLHQAALRYAKSGLSLIRINEHSKRPYGSWKDAQSTPASPRQIAAWPSSTGAFALVCGAVSGGKNENGQSLYVTCIDIDVAEFCPLLQAQVGELLSRMPLQKTGKGFQLLFRSPLLVRNEKLAYAPDVKEKTGRKIAIETRGQGGYAVIAPSTHPSGSRYEWLRGDLESIPVLTEEEVQAIFAASRDLDQTSVTAQDAARQADEAKDAQPKARKTNPYTAAVIEAFNAAHPIEEMLEKHGYTRRGERFARPGGTSPSVYVGEGRSFHHNSNDAMRDGHSHSAFDVCCHLDHGDDFKAALKAAAEELDLPLNGATASRQERNRMHREFKAQAEARGVPIIESNRRQLREKLHDLREALAAANAAMPRLFRGPEGLVAVANDQDEEAKLKCLSSFGMQVFASEAAFWIGIDSRGTTIEVDPPRELGENLLASPNYWDAFPPIERVVTAPFFDAKGQLCDTKGFYPESRTWLALGPGFTIGNTEPTTENVAAAKRMLLETILGEVAFEDESSRAHALALMILPFIRLLIQGPTPLHMIMAPVVSSGKSYLAHLCTSAFSTAAPTSEKGNLEEWRKSLLAKLVTGAPILWLDNLKKNLDSPTLDMAITSPSGYIEDRLTGTALNVRAPAWCVYMGTANNITLTDDAASRTIVISVVPTDEDPSQQVYKHDPKEFILANRGAVCGAIITLVRAWQDAGCPNYSGKFTTRFPLWTRSVGGILETVGVPGFLENFAKYRRLVADDLNDAWTEFVLLWDRDKGSAPVSAKELLPLALRVTALSASLSKVEGDAKERRWGQLLVKQRNRVYAGFKINDGPTIQRKVTYVLTPRPLTPKDAGEADTTDGADASGADKKSATPEAVAPEAVAPEAVAPEAVAPEAVAPEAVAPEAVETPPANGAEAPAPLEAVGDAEAEPHDADEGAGIPAPATGKAVTAQVVLPPSVSALYHFMQEVWGREWPVQDIVWAMRLKGLIAPS